MSAFEQFSFFSLCPRHLLNRVRCGATAGCKTAAFTDHCPAAGSPSHCAMPVARVCLAGTRSRLSAVQLSGVLFMQCNLDQRTNLRRCPQRPLPSPLLFPVKDVEVSSVLMSWIICGYIFFFMISNQAILRFDSFLFALASFFVLLFSCAIEDIQLTLSASVGVSRGMK